MVKYNQLITIFDVNKSVAIMRKVGEKNMVFERKWGIQYMFSITSNGLSYPIKCIFDYA